MKVISIETKRIYECTSNYYNKFAYCTVNIHGHSVDVLKINFIPLSEYRKNKLNNFLKSI